MKYKVMVYEANLLQYEVEAENENEAKEKILSHAIRLNPDENDNITHKEPLISPKKYWIKDYRVDEVKEC